MTLKTDYKDYQFQEGETLRKYQQISNNDGTISLRDVTPYQQEGDRFSASDINSTNAKVNELDQTVGGIKTDVSVLQTKSFEGTSGTIETQSGYLHDMMIFGKSVQNGTPTPENPIEIQSVVNPKVTISNSDNSLSQVATLPYTLKGTDYVDIERKKLVRNFGELTLNGSENWSKDASGIYITINSLIKLNNYSNSILCDRYKTIINHYELLKNDKCITAYYDSKNVYKENYLYIKDSDYSTVEDLKSALSTNNAKIIYQLATPTEIDLTDEEVAQFKALKTYEPTTNIIASSDVLNPLVKCDYSLNKETNNIYDRLQENASDVSNITNRLNGLTFVALTQTEYNALSTKDANTIYFITEG